MKEVKKQIQKNLTSEIKKMVENLRDNDIDPIGFGDLYRTKHKKWNEKEFYTVIYPALQFEINTEIKIKQSGVGL